MAAGIPTATWLDEIAALEKMRAVLEQAQAQQRSTDTDALCVFVVYNLPGRDCSAAASAGELSGGELERYEDDFIRPIAELAKEFESVPMVFVIEPDSLPNVVTNMGRPKCSMVAEDYKNGIAIAIQYLGELGTVYVDVGWSGWIGTWGAGNMARLLGEVFELAGDAARLVRGFVVNVSNYGGVAAETAYAAALRTALVSEGYSNMAYIVDTGRNGAGRPLGTWCNPQGAGMGEPPTANPHAAYADAFFWIKPPGESDGVSLATAPRFDPECAKGASWNGAPQAGEWFNDMFVELVQRASPSLARAPSYTPVARPLRPPRPPRPPPSPPNPGPPPDPPEPVSDDDFFESQRSDWLQSDEHLQQPATQQATRPAQQHLWMRHSRPPPPPSPRPPPSASPPAPAPLSDDSPGAWSVAMVSFVAVLALMSLMGGKSTERSPPKGVRTTSRTAPSPKASLPRRASTRARETLYAEVNQSTEPMGTADEMDTERGTERAPAADEASSRPRRQGRRTSAESPKSASADEEEEQYAPTDRSPAVVEEPEAVLEEARAMAARIQKAKERELLEQEIEQLNSKMTHLDSELSRTTHGPSATDVDQALSGLRRGAAAQSGRFDPGKAGWLDEME